ncbi:MAG: alpha/beta hydrolase [Chloroflexaceae bacterium]|nr:alpha/beta hydrolase [Chloroflexaceae bacterium]
MTNSMQRIFLHGLESSSQGFKATMFRELFPDAIHTPDFTGPLPQRMDQLYEVVQATTGWIMVGSSFGGLMAAVFACTRPNQVERLVLLAPAINLPEFASYEQQSVSIPTTIYHGRRDDVVPLSPVRQMAERVFVNLTFHEVDDDHMLRSTVQSIDWQTLLALP